MRTPESVRTMLAAFPSTDEAGGAVSAIIGAGVVPAAIEMMDALAIEAAEAAVQCGYPAGAGAVLVIELDGPHAEVEAQFTEVEQHCRDNGAFEIRIAADDAERALFWKGRKSAFAAVGRISPDYIVQDGVIPRTALPEVLRRIAELSSGSGVRVANVFHAGDGNLHPLVLFDDAVPGEAEEAENVSAAILDLCIEHGGSITGEHGVGADKVKYMPRMFTDDDLDTMQMLRCAFDPAHLSNPGKVFPTPRLCGEVPGRHKGAHPLTRSRAGRRCSDVATDAVREDLAEGRRRPGRPAGPAMRSVASTAGTSCRRPRPRRWPSCCASPGSTTWPSCRAGPAPRWTGALHRPESTSSSTPGASAGSSSTPPATWSSRCARVRRSASSKKSWPGPVSSWRSTRRTRGPPWAARSPSPRAGRDDCSTAPRGTCSSASRSSAPTVWSPRRAARS